MLSVITYFFVNMNCYVNKKILLNRLSKDFQICGLSIL